MNNEKLTISRVVSLFMVEKGGAVRFVADNSLGFVRHVDPVEHVVLREDGTTVTFHRKPGMTGPMVAFLGNAVAHVQIEVKRRIRIWKKHYSPWIMGGDVHAPIGVDVEVSSADEVDLGKGFKGFRVAGPDCEVIVDKASGGVIGRNLDEIRDDIEKGDAKVMQAQITQAVDTIAKIRLVEPEEFWAVFQAKQAHD